MTDEEEFEKLWGENETRKRYEDDFNLYIVKPVTRYFWLEKGKCDREKVTEIVNHVVSYNLPHLAGKRLRELLEEMG